MKTLSAIFHRCNEYMDEHTFASDLLTAGCFIASTALMFVLMLVAFAPSAAFASTSVAYSEREIVAAVNDGAEQVDIRNMGWNYTESCNTYIRNLDGMPRCLSRNSSVRAAKNESRTLTYFIPRFDCAPSEVAARNNAYWNEVRRLAANAKGTQYDKALYLYDELLNRCSYHYASIIDREAYGKHCTATSALLDGSSVCAGYADALSDLFNAVGIEAHVESNTNHAWVVCFIDGVRYTCDPTTDDFADASSHDRFMISSSGQPFRPQRSDVVSDVAGADIPNSTSNAETTGIERARKNAETQVLAQASYDVQDSPSDGTVEPQKRDKIRVPIGVCRIDYLDIFQLRLANQTIYMPIKRGFYNPFNYKAGLFLYAVVDRHSTMINGKPHLVLDMPDVELAYREQ